MVDDPALESGVRIKDEQNHRLPEIETKMITLHMAPGNYWQMGCLAEVHEFLLGLMRLSSR